VQDQAPAKRSNAINTYGGRPSNYKTRLCRKWQEHGECSFANHCNFAHGHEELRTGGRNASFLASLARGSGGNVPADERERLEQEKRDEVCVCVFVCACVCVCVCVCAEGGKEKERERDCYIIEIDCVFKCEFVCLLLYLCQRYRNQIVFFSFVC
jgi:hypothetical protein